MKKYLLTSMLFVVVLFNVALEQSDAISFKEENNSNIYLVPTYNDRDSDVITIDWSTPESVPHTYWAVHNFEGGYAGFQNTGNDRNTFHFSLWDKVDDTEDRIKAEYLSPITDASSFGGEGTGMKAYTEYPWKENEWYTMLIRNWQEDGRTKYGQWIKKPDGTWLLTAILDHPETYVMNTSSLFQEDFWGPKDDTRSFKVKNHYSLDTTTREWHSYDEKYISNNRGDESDVWDGGATDEYFWGKVGPQVNPSIENNTKLKINQPATPDMPEISLDSFKVNIENGQLKANWKLTETSSPQFQAHISIKNNGQTKRTFEPVRPYEQTFSTTMTDFDKKAGDVICLSITDVYNNTKEFIYDKDLDVDFDVNENIVENIRLLGVFSQRASELDLQSNGQITYKKENINWPHNYRDGNYMGLTIKRNNKEIYKKILDAKDEQEFSDTIQLEKGDMLEIYHEDPENIFCINKKLINSSKKRNIIEYTGKGYINKDIPSDDDTSNTETTPEIPEEVVPNRHAYNVFFQGYDDIEFANFTYDSVENKGILHTLDTDHAPHNNFNENYASITVKNQKGKQTFNKVFKGTEQQKAAIDEITIKEDYTITFTHLEPTGGVKGGRLQIIDLATEKPLENAKEVTYKVTENGWEKI